MKIDKNLEVLFSINSYDYEGDCYDKCVRLNINDLLYLKFENPNQFKKFADCLVKMAQDVEECWEEHNG